VLLRGEDVLDGGADLGTRGIGALAPGWQRLARRSAEVDFRYPVT